MKTAILLSLLISVTSFAASPSGRPRPPIASPDKFATPNIEVQADSRWTAFGAYLQRVLDRVQAKWDLEIAQKKLRSPGTKVTVKFTLDDTGDVSQIAVPDSNAGEEASKACVTAITAAYGAWTKDMKAALGSKQTLTFTFYYR